MTIEQEMQELIQKNLPAQAAGEMKKYIEEAELTKSDLENTLKVLENTRKNLQEERARNNEMAKKITAQQEMDKREQECIKREEALCSRESKLELEMARQEISLLKVNHTKIESLVEKVFGHPSVTVTNTSTRQVKSELDEYGTPRYNPNTETLFDSETIETKHSKE